MKRFALVVALLACRTPEPVFIDEPVVKPLPPASGTPIGILLDDGGQLNLRPDQRAKLEEIDRTLATRNDVLAGAQRSSERPPPPAGGPGGGMGGPGGGMGGGMGGPGGGMGGPGGGMGGGMGGPGGGMGGPGGGMGGPPSGGRRGGPPPDRKPPGAHKHVDAEIAANIHAAIDEAFALLDPDQRLKAEALLDERGALPSKQRPPGPPPGGQRPPPPTERDE